MGCDSSCLTCNGPNSNNCLSCADSSKYLSNYSCVSICPAGTYADSSNILLKKCVNCDTSCASCYGANSNNCNTCSNTNYYLYLNSCVSNCPTTYYADSTDKKCY